MTECMNATSARQIRAARAILDWSQEDLANVANLSIATIRKLELGYISPRQSTTSVIRQALEGAGLEFIEPDGVRRRPDEILTFQGTNGRGAFLDDIHQTIRRTGGDVVLVETSEITFTRWKQENACNILARLLDINGTTTIKCLLTEIVAAPISTPRFEFRFISVNYIDPMPFCVYGDKFAMMTSGAGTDAKIIVMRSPCAAKTSLRQFFSMWEKATPFSVGTEMVKAVGRKTA